MNTGVATDLENVVDLKVTIYPLKYNSTVIRLFIRLIVQLSVSITFVEEDS